MTVILNWRKSYKYKIGYLDTSNNKTDMATLLFSATVRSLNSSACVRAQRTRETRRVSEGGNVDMSTVPIACIASAVSAAFWALCSGNSLGHW